MGKQTEGRLIGRQIAAEQMHWVSVRQMDKQARVILEFLFPALPCLELSSIFKPPEAWATIVSNCT